MITHFAEVTLLTTSVAGVVQFYKERLRFPVTAESDGKIRVRVNAHTQLTFVESHEKLAPVHLAFEVPMSAFEQVVLHLQQQLGHPLAWPDGNTITTFSDGQCVYYKDFDGNLLEWIAHGRISENVLKPVGLLQVMYLREVGLPVHDVEAATAWLRAGLELDLLQASELFAFARGGTAHAVVVSTSRKWIPIGMAAIPPNLKIAYGVHDLKFIGKVAERLEERGQPYRWSSDRHRLSFAHAGYAFEIRYTPEFPESRIKALNLPE